MQKSTTGMSTERNHSDLREQLSTKLLDVFSKGFVDLRQPDGSVNVVTVWNLVADECIRQMEWARRPDREVEVTQYWEKGAGPAPTVIRTSELPLTLAPDDWKP